MGGWKSDNKNRSYHDNDITNPIMNKNLKNVYCIFILFNLSANVKKSIIPEKSKKSQISNKYLKPLD